MLYLLRGELRDKQTQNKNEVYTMSIDIEKIEGCVEIEVRSL